MQRPAKGLLLSGVIAGSGVTLGPMLQAVVQTLAGPGATSLSLQLIIAGLYSIGFIVVILGHTDLFTEYTTMAILTVLTGDTPVSALARLWLLVYVGNLLGAAALAALWCSSDPGSTSSSRQC